MTHFSLAATRLPINDIRSFSDIISAGFQYHAEHDGVFKSAYRENLNVTGGLSFAVMLIKSPFTHSIQALLSQFLNNRDFKEAIPPHTYTDALAYIISEAMLIMSKHSKEDYEHALKKRVQKLFENVLIPLMGKQQEADHLAKLLLI